MSVNASFPPGAGGGGGGGVRSCSRLFGVNDGNKQHKEHFRLNISINSLPESSFQSATYWIRTEGTVSMATPSILHSSITFCFFFFKPFVSMLKVLFNASPRKELKVICSFFLSAQFQLLLASQLAGGCRNRTRGLTVVSSWNLCPYAHQSVSSLLCCRSAVPSSSAFPRRRCCQTPAVIYHGVKQQ